MCLLCGTDWIFIYNSGYVFCVDLRTNSDYFPIQHLLTDFYNRGGVCLPRGTSRIFIYSIIQVNFGLQRVNTVWSLACCQEVTAIMAVLGSYVCPQKVYAESFRKVPPRVQWNACTVSNSHRATLSSSHNSPTVLTAQATCHVTLIPSPDLSSR